MSAEAVATLLVYRGNTNVLTAWGLRLTDLMEAGLPALSAGDYYTQSGRRSFPVA